MKIEQITNFLESIAPIKLQESYDNSGLIIGAKDTEVRNVLITLDVTEDVIEEAVKKGCNLIIAHHPIVFFGMKRFNGNNYVERIVIMAIRNNIAIYACHTNIDKVHNGVNNMICRKIGIKSHLTILSVDSKNVHTTAMIPGSGMIGILEEPEFAIDFLLKIKKIFKCGVIKHTSKFNKEIKTIAVCGGAGFSLLPIAKEKGVDLYITSDVTYHQFFDADDKIILVDIGHYESEQYTKDLFLNLLNSEYAIDGKSPFIISEINTNPVKYL